MMFPHRLFKTYNESRCVTEETFHAWFDEYSNPSEEKAVLWHLDTYSFHG